MYIREARLRKKLRDRARVRGLLATPVSTCAGKEVYFGGV